MSASGRDDLPDVQEWSGNPPGCLGVVRRPSRMPRKGRETLSYVLEALPDIQEWSGGPSGCLRVVRRPSQMFGSGQETLPNVR